MKNSDEIMINLILLISTIWRSQRDASGYSRKLRFCSQGDEELIKEIQQLGNVLNLKEKSTHQSELSIQLLCTENKSNKNNKIKEVDT